MAALQLLLPAPPASWATTRVADHAKATFTGQAIVLTFPYLDADGTLSDLARTWVEQARAGNRLPVTRPGPPRLARATLTGLFANPADSQASVEDKLVFLRALAAAENPIVVTFGGLYSDVHWTASGRWVIRDLSIHVTHRRHTDNAATRAEATIELLEANVPGWVPLPSTFRYNVEIPGAGTGRARTVEVLPGDSLWAIAWREYGDPSRWIAIGDANGILKPSSLAQLGPGTVLVLP